eukprot:3280075-Pleurochrysis_carterae.AAC.5
MHAADGGLQEVDVKPSRFVAKRRDVQEVNASACTFGRDASRPVFSVIAPVAPIESAERCKSKSGAVHAFLRGARVSAHCSRRTARCLYERRRGASTLAGRAAALPSGALRLAGGAAR